MPWLIITTGWTAASAALARSVALAAANPGMVVVATVCPLFLGGAVLLGLGIRARRSRRSSS